MKSIYLSLLICALFAPMAVFASTAEVVVIRGSATFKGQKIEKGMELKNSGLIKVGKKSFLKIKLVKWGNTITLGPRSEMELDLSKDTKPTNKYSLKKGACRWISKLGKEGKGGVTTRQASLGVRGTDFIVKANPSLGETEIIVLDGQVDFSNLGVKDDSALVGKGQWGGIGGRFGQKIGKILDLPKEVVNGFNKMLKI